MLAREQHTYNSVTLAAQMYDHGELDHLLSIMALSIILFLGALPSAWLMAYLLDSKPESDDLVSLALPTTKRKFILYPTIRSSLSPTHAYSSLHRISKPKEKSQFRCTGCPN